MGLGSFNKQSRPGLFRRLSGEPLDLLIIGGGITGASVFRDAALRKMRVALVEANDFASATSGRSSKLVHGGLRYLKSLGFRLAWESCHERNLHVRAQQAPGASHALSRATLQGQGESRALMRLGMVLYEGLSGFRNYRLHRFMSREETLSLAPALPVDGLTGGCLYYDAVVSDNRWTVETVKDGVRHGGVAVNHAPLIGLLREDGKIIGGRIHDKIGGEHYEVRARAIVNATGVFADQIRRMDDPESAQLVRLSKGTHLVFAEEDVPLSVTVVFSSPLDGRSLFLAKHEGCFLYGTSDDWEEADPGAPIPSVRDIEYLLSTLDRFMPEAGLDGQKARFVYSGFRPLLCPGNGDLDSAAASREDHIEVSPSGLISVIGGKLTTARIIAIRVLDRVIERIGGSTTWSKCRTHRLSIGGTNEAVAEGLAYWVKRYPRLAWYFQILYQRYGLDAHTICREAMAIHKGLDPDPRAEPIRAEVRYVCRNEMVCTLEDLLERRAGFLYWSAEQRLERARYGARVIRAELDLTE
ncbi:MAG TPA: glycerol-3-phosphate dehydrogenase/oxidase, partial [Rubrobacter sp.]|nr:glycerol-3-phosphate dehydrogenase/oxidase [Rubrobacter sp.]